MDDETRQRLREKVIDYLDAAHVMEQQILRELDWMISSTEQERRWPGIDALGLPDLVAEFEQHKAETERHERLLRERLDALGAGTSRGRRLRSRVTGLAKGLAETGASDKTANNARHSFITEHTEIAAYALLERLAERAGDSATAELARANRADDEAMAAKVAARWDQVLDLTLAADGLPEATALAR